MSAKIEIKCILNWAYTVRSGDFRSQIESLYKNPESICFIIKVELSTRKFA